MFDFNEYALGQRRAFHRIPEVGFTEFLTTYRIYEQLKDSSFALHIGEDVLDRESRFGVPEEDVVGQSIERAKNRGVPAEFIQRLDGLTGLVATLDTGRPGAHLAMRFDIDGLPIKESEDTVHFPKAAGFHSVHAGEMHACGHDGHIATGLSVARFIEQHKEELCGKFTLVFQPAEEGGRGAYSVVKKGWLDDVDYFVSGHLGIVDRTAGSVAATAENFLATTKFNVSFTGKSAHAGVEPDAGRNALLAAAQTLVGLQSIPRHKDGATRINAGTLEGGSGRNVIADKAYMQVETRGETTELDRYMYDYATRLIKYTALAHGVEADIKFMGRAVNSVCDKEWVGMIKEATAGDDDLYEVMDTGSLGASEDVTYMINHVQDNGGKATFMVFPSPLEYGHHHPRFDIDETSIRTAVSVYGDIIKFLNHEKYEIGS